MSSIAPLGAMANIKALLNADSTLVAAVPKSQIYPENLPKEPVYPCVVYNVLNEPDFRYADDVADMEIASVEIQAWQVIGVSPTPIAQAVIRIMRDAGWSRDFAGRFTFTDGSPYWVLRFTKSFEYA